MAHRVGAAGSASEAILSAFDGDAVSAVLGAGAAPFGHHGGAVTAIVASRAGFRHEQVAGGRHKLGNSSALPGVVT